MPCNSHGSSKRIPNSLELQHNNLTPRYQRLSYSNQNIFRPIYIIYMPERPFKAWRHNDVLCVHEHVSKSIGIIGLHYVIPWGWGSLCSECSQSKNPRLEQSMMNLSHNWCSSCSAKRKTKHQEPQLDSNSEAAA